VSDAAAKPWITVTPAVMAKTSLSVVLMCAGMYYLVSGRRDADATKMITGAILAVASVFLFI
jgi:hypothetical protein